MHVLSFSAAVLLLLLTPGPTNTLMMLAGYGRGWRGALTLIAAELAGYLLVIVPVLLVAAPALALYPSALVWARGVAAVWVLFLSWRLWYAANRPPAPGGDLDGLRVFLTTALNPKAPIIALVIMPQIPFVELLPWLVLFSGFVVLAANLWLIAGAQAARGAGRRLGPGIVRRLAAAGLFGFALLLASSSVHAMA
ncbi:threonine transporter RhtB [Pseudorhizobium endolithicum]|uniref:Threonine transporter RhtB n=1 Tax=Pseudorhizobium endolithicum TaxID=1191678 RepID=A0ABN7JGF9_9HYPH|nr:threonine transporter RhtB [Pseudorhizobium endolithicum]CAD7030021.1 threonine transporter RhtB [Pseudorhizobium endolithicum]